MPKMWASKQVKARDSGSLIRDARDYALLHGLVLRYDSMTSDNSVAHIPFTLFPSPFPKKLYTQCLELQPIVNKLMLKIANDNDFMLHVLAPIAEVDEFTRNLLSINNSVQREGKAQPILCCINRADYMLDRYAAGSGQAGELRARQVEVNAIASSMSAHSHNTKLLQDFCMSKYNITKTDSSSFPQNDSLALVAQGLIDAHDAYGRTGSQILLVAEARSMNFSDQFLIEVAVGKLRPDIKFARRSFAKLPGRVRLGPNRELLLEDNLEVSVVYFRYGYDPSNYNFELAWETRLLLERSRAIKCPSINFHLSGAKKFQQVLNRPEDLERFLDGPEAQRLAEVFCKFWSIECDQGEGFKLATSRGPASKLVLKPQREGGGHNIFGSDIEPFVTKLADKRDRSQYILMEYIDGPREKNWLLLQTDQGDADRMGASDELISELGIFGSVLADGSAQILSNEAAGYLIRSKKFGVNEGGVATGYAGISNLVLLADDDLKSENYFSYFV